MNELIKAIELIKVEINDFETNFMCDKDNSHDIGFVAGLHRAKSLVRSLQSTNVAPDWIPCSERLPSESGNYLITVADLRLGHNGEHTVTMADFYAKAKKWNSIVDVVAWMPLPEPYREDDE